MNAVTKHEEPHAGMLPADPMVSMIERVALDPNADLDKLERMLAMKERMEKDAASKAFSEALAAAQSAMPSVAARHNNDQTRSKYAKLKDIYEACKPIAAQHGFSFNAIPTAGGRDGYMNMRWTLRKGAHSESDVSEVPIDDKGMKGTANKTGTHAYGSTTSYGRRYLFCAVFDIAIGDDDDGNSAAKRQQEAPTAAELEALATRLQSHPSSVTDFFLTRFGVPDLGAINLNQLREANVMLTKREAAAKEGKQ